LQFFATILLSVKNKSLGGIKMKATVDQNTCIGCGLCANDCPEVFKIEGDKAVGGPVPAGKEDACKNAAANCPVQCIKCE